MSARDALFKYNSRQLRNNQRKKRTNKKPEKEVEKEVLAWFERHGFDVNVVESKAVFSKAAGRYLRGQAKSGFSDIVGNYKDGTAIYIELKAPGRRATVSELQMEFLLRKIRTNCFACVVDGEKSLHELWNGYVRQSAMDRSKFLLEQLPHKRVKHSETIESESLDKFFSD